MKQFRELLDYTQNKIEYDKYGIDETTLKTIWNALSDAVTKFESSQVSMPNEFKERFISLIRSAESVSSQTISIHTLKLLLSDKPPTLTEIISKADELGVVIRKTTSCKSIDTDQNKGKYLVWGWVDRAKNLCGNVACQLHLDPGTCDRETTCIGCDNHIPNAIGFTKDTLEPIDADVEKDCHNCLHGFSGCVDCINQETLKYWEPIK